MFSLVSVLALALDQITKYIVSSNMTENQTISLIPGIFDLTYIKNTGAAFGMLAGKQLLLNIITLVLILGMVVYVILKGKTMLKSEKLALALIVGGGAGNLLSRFLYSFVVDFFNCYFWPIFNVADIAICIGCVLLVIAVLIIEPRKEKKNERTE